MSDEPELRPDEVEHILQLGRLMELFGVDVDPGDPVAHVAAPWWLRFDTTTEDRT